MPPPDSIICCICGGKYFKKSLPHHHKVCAEKHNVPLIICDYCSIPVPKPDLTAHMAKRCPNASSSQKRPTASMMDSNATDGPGDYDPDGRVPCETCGRRFIRDRIAVHQDICHKRASNTRPQFNSARQRQIESGVLPTSSVNNPQRKPLNLPQTTNLKPPKIPTVGGTKASYTPTSPTVNRQKKQESAELSPTVIRRSKDSSQLHSPLNNRTTAHSSHKQCPTTNNHMDSVFQETRNTETPSQVLAQRQPLARQNIRQANLSSQFGGGGRVGANPMGGGNHLGSTRSSGQAKIINSNITSPDNPLLGWNIS